MLTQQALKTVPLRTRGRRIGLPLNALQVEIISGRQITEQVRSTYDGPFVLATDYMVFNVTQEDIRVRMAVVDEDIWPLPSVTEKLSANPADRVGFSPFIIGGRQVYQDVIEEIYADINETYGTSFPAPTGRPGGN